MTLNEHLVRMAHNNRWCNHRLLTACRALREDEYRAERPAYFGTIHATLNHILIVDLAYLGRLKGERRVSDDCEELHVTLARLVAHQSGVDRELIDYCGSQTADSLASSVQFVRANNQPYSETVLDVLTHLFLHQVHHRGQVHGMLSGTTVAPPQLDEFFLAGDLDLRRKELKVLDLPCA